MGSGRFRNELLRSFGALLLDGYYSYYSNYSILITTDCTNHTGYAGYAWVLWFTHGFLSLMKEGMDKQKCNARLSGWGWTWRSLDLPLL